MPELSQKSLNKLSQCHPDLQRVMLEVIKVIDFTVIEGYRTKEDQDVRFYQGTSRVKWPNSKHNTFPSQAIDIWPWPVPRDAKGELDSNSPKWNQLAAVVLEKAAELGVEIEWGGNWTTIVDKPHYSLKKP